MTNLVAKPTKSNIFMSKRILIIEDDPKMSNVYNRAFNFAKFNVEIANNGKEGFEKVVTFHPDIILLDIMMPIMNGMDVLKKLQESEKTKNIPVIMLTNIVSGTRDKAEEAVGLGAKAYIIKSDHDPKEVVSIVRKYID